MLAFLGLPVPSRRGGLLPVPDMEYAPLHALSLKGGRFTPQPMLNATRHRLAAFYAPHNERLAQLLDDPRFLWNGDHDGDASRPEAGARNRRSAESETQTPCTAR